MGVEAEEADQYIRFRHSWPTRVQLNLVGIGNESDVRGGVVVEFLPLSVVADPKGLLRLLLKRWEQLLILHERD